MYYMAKFRITKSVKNGRIEYTIRKLPFLFRIGKKFNNVNDCIDYIYSNYDISKCVIKYDKIW